MRFYAACHRRAAGRAAVDRPAAVLPFGTRSKRVGCMATAAPEAAVDPVLADELAAIERLHQTGIIDLDERRTQRKEALDAWRLRHQAARFPPGLTDSSPAATALLIPLAPALATPSDAVAEAELAAPTKAGGAGRAQPHERSPSRGQPRVRSAQCTRVDDHPTPPAYAGAPSDAAVQSSCCVVCGVPLAAPIRGKARARPGYRKNVACLRAGVCLAHLAGDHLIRGVLSRYCTNHHALHPIAEFGGTANVTCDRARVLSATHVLNKRQRELAAAGEADETWTAAADRDGRSLVFPCTLPIARVLSSPDRATMPSLSAGANSLGAPSGVLDHDGDNVDLGDELEGLDELLDHFPADSDGLITPPAAIPASIEVLSGPALLRTPQPTAQLPSVLEACTNVAETARYLDALSMNSAMRCIAGTRAQAYSRQHASVAVLYGLAKGLFASISSRQMAILENDQVRVEAVVRQARADEAAFHRGKDTGIGTPTAADLSALLDHFIASADRRVGILKRVMTSALASSGVVVYCQEMLDANNLQINNLRLVTALLQGAALCASPEIHLTIVRLSADWLLTAMLRSKDALMQRRVWMTNLSTGTEMASGMGNSIREVTNSMAKVCLARLGGFWATGAPEVE